MTRSRWLWALITAVVLASGLWQWRQEQHDRTAATSAASPAVSAPDARAGQAAGPASGAESASPAATSAPVSPPGSASAAVGDEAAERAVLSRLIPVWASADLSTMPARLGPQQWVATWRGMPGVSQQFVTASQGEYLNSLFGGAVRLNVSVTGAKISSARRLWAQPGESMWRVEVTRRVTGNNKVSALNGAESVGWDLRMGPGAGGPVVLDFTAPSTANEKPPTPDATSGSTPSAGTASPTPTSTSTSTSASTSAGGGS